MIDIPARALLLGAAGIILTAVPLPTDEASAGRPKVKVLCLAPGSSQPTPCGSARSNSILEVNYRGSAASPGYLIFSEVDAIGVPRVVRVPISGGPGGAVRIGVPPQLCASRDSDRWRVQLVSGSAAATSIGAVTVRC